MRRWISWFFKPSRNASPRRIHWSRVGVSSGILLVGGWLLVATATWVYLLKIREITTVAAGAVYNPFALPELRQRIGEHHITEGQAALRRGEYGAALLHLRAGLARAPRNPAARLDLAALYVAHRRPELAKTLLLDRLPELSADEDYVRATLQFLLEFHYDAELQQTCTELLRHTTVGPSLPAYYAAKLAHLRGNYDQSDALLREHHLDQQSDGILLAAQNDAERGLVDRALVRVEALINAGTDFDDAYALASDLRRRLGQHDSLQRTAVLRLAANPFSAQPRLDLLRLAHERGSPQKFSEELTDYLRHFANDQPSLLALGDFAASSGLPNLARRLRAHFEIRGWPTDTPTLMIAEAHLAAGEYQQGLDLLTKHLRTHPSADKQTSPVFDSLQAIALFGLGRADQAQLHLEHLLAQPNLRAENLRVVAERLIALGQAAQARTLLARAVELDPLNQRSLTQLVELEAQNDFFDTLATNTRRLLSTRRPSPTVLALVAAKLGSDRHLLRTDQAVILREIRQQRRPARSQN